MAATAHGERNLTLRGVTRSITFDVQYHGQSRFRGTRTRLVANAKTQINRSDFGVGQAAGVQVGAVR